MHLCAGLHVRDDRNARSAVSAPHHDEQDQVPGIQRRTAPLGCPHDRERRGSCDLQRLVPNWADRAGARPVQHAGQQAVDLQLRSVERTRLELAPIERGRRGRQHRRLAEAASASGTRLSAGQACLHRARACRSPASTAGPIGHPRQHVRAHRFCSARLQQSAARGARGAGRGYCAPVFGPEAVCLHDLEVQAPRHAAVVPHPLVWRPSPAGAA